MWHHHLELKVKLLVICPKLQMCWVWLTYSMEHGIRKFSAGTINFKMMTQAHFLDGLVPIAGIIWKWHGSSRLNTCSLWLEGSRPQSKRGGKINPTSIFWTPWFHVAGPLGVKVACVHLLYGRCQPELYGSALPPLNQATTQCPTPDCTVPSVVMLSPSGQGRPHPLLSLISIKF